MVICPPYQCYCRVSDPVGSLDSVSPPGLFGTFVLYLLIRSGSLGWGQGGLCVSMTWSERWYIRSLVLSSQIRSVMGTSKSSPLQHYHQLTGRPYFNLAVPLQYYLCKEGWHTGRTDLCSPTSDPKSANLSNCWLGGVAVSQWVPKGRGQSVSPPK